MVTSCVHGRGQLMQMLLVGSVVSGAVGSVAHGETVEKTFALPGQNVRFYTIAPAAQGGYMLAGALDSTKYAVRVDGSGNALWNLNYTADGNGGIAGVTQTADGGWALFGSATAGFYREGQSLVKTDDTGKVTWGHTYGYIDVTDPAAIKMLPDGSLITIGRTTETDPWLDFHIAKMTSDGALSWTKNYGNRLDDTGHDIVLTHDGGYLAAGYSGLWSGNTDGYLIKMDANGNAQWTKSWDHGWYDNFNGVVATADGGYVACGDTQDNYFVNDRAVLVKFDANGNELWEKVYADVGNGNLGKVFELANGDFVMMGSMKGADGHTGLWLAETDASGGLISSNIYYGAGDAWGSGLVALPNGFAAVGYTSDAAGMAEGYFVATVAAVPEPASLGLLVLGAFGLLGCRRSRKA